MKSGGMFRLAKVTTVLISLPEQFSSQTPRVIDHETILFLLLLIFIFLFVPFLRVRRGPKL